MARRFSLLNIAGQLIAAAICATLPQIASGAATSGIRPLQSSDKLNAAVLLQDSAFRPAALSSQNISPAGSSNPGVHPPNSKPYGMTYGEWSARWWAWVLSIPASMNPNLDTTGADCSQGQSGHVWFLAGTFGGPANRTCTIPTGVSVLISILTTAFGAGLGDCLSPGWGNSGPCDVTALRAAAAAQENNPQQLSLTVNGVPLRDLNAYRSPSPEFAYTLPPDNVLAFLFNFPVPKGTYFPAVADGYWVMFTPFSPGVHYIDALGVQSDGFTVHVSYTLIVRP
ncbi:MAG: hypothetical protein ACJ746_19305 [Bryobacteraceae bacterium]